MWIGLWIFSITTVVLTWLLIGRSRSGSPECASCHYPVDSSSPTICPECGSDLTLPNATVAKARTRSKDAILASVAVVLVAGVSIEIAEGWRPWIRHPELRAYERNPSFATRTKAIREAAETPDDEPVQRRLARALWRDAIASDDTGSRATYDVVQHLPAFEFDDRTYDAIVVPHLTRFADDDAAWSVNDAALLEELLDHVALDEDESALLGEAFGVRRIEFGDGSPMHRGTRCGLWLKLGDRPYESRTRGFGVTIRDVDQKTRPTRVWTYASMLGWPADLVDGPVTLEIAVYPRSYDGVVDPDPSLALTRERVTVEPTWTTSSPIRGLEPEIAREISHMVTIGYPPRVDPADTFRMQLWIQPSNLVHWVDFEVSARTAGGDRLLERIDYTVESQFQISADFHAIEIPNATWIPESFDLVVRMTRAGGPSGEFQFEHELVFEDLDLLRMPWVGY